MSNTAGTLTVGNVRYTASYSFDMLGRLVSGPLGPYTYGLGLQNATNPAPLHAALSIGLGGGGAAPPVTGRAPTPARAPQPGHGLTDGSTGSAGGERGPSPNPGGPGITTPPYTAMYDVVGNMTCRSTSTTLSLSCSGGNTGGAQLGYDNEGRLVSWQNTPSSPTTTVTDAYDGEGQRVVQKVTSGSTTTTTDYLAGGLAEQVVGGALTSYYSVAGVVTAVSVGGTLSYLASDGLGSVTAALSSTSAVLAASQLFGPYGSVRYQSGVMPTAKGFTGQYGDAATGLDYYNARYYDPLAGQFISADSVLPGDGMDVWGLSRFAYVEGNPETSTDPSGHRVCMSADCDRGGGRTKSKTDSPCDNWRCKEGAVVTTNGAVLSIEQQRVKWILQRLNDRTVYVSGYTRADGTVVAPYFRRPPGALDRIALFERFGKYVDAAGIVVTVAGFALDWYDTSTSYYNARPDQGMGQAVAMGAYHAVLVTSFAVAGAAVGQALIPIPFVGAAIGGMAGAWLGGWLGDQVVQANEASNNSPQGDSGDGDSVVPGL